jgi:hypothetical protein
MKKAILISMIAFITGKAVAQNNFIGTDPFLPLFGTVAINYERAILPRMSVGIGFGQKLSSGILEVSGIDNERLKTSNLSFEGIRILPEFRWYISKSDEGLTGFYVGVYYKYQTNNTAVSSTYTPDNVPSIPANIDFDLRIKTHSAGLQLGYKLFAYKKFYADFLFAGIGLSRSELETEIKSDVPDGYFDELSGGVKRFFILKGLKPKLVNRDDQLQGTFTSLALRYGIKVGIGF